MVARGLVTVSPLQGSEDLWKRSSWAFSPGFHMVGLEPWTNLCDFVRLAYFRRSITVSQSWSVSLINRRPGAVNRPRMGALAETK